MILSLNKLMVTHFWS